jgi:membrane associated rhomboid family serine protease
MIPIIYLEQPRWLQGAASSANNMEGILLSIWVAAIIAPLLWAWKEKASIAMALTLSLLFGYIVQMIWYWTGYWYLVDYLWMRPALVESGVFHTLITSGFVHNPVDPLHVLSNIIIIALVGIPLEERLGRGRWCISYLVGLLGGSIAWTLANPGSTSPVLGASGAAFGILGAYLMGWPRDEVFFPFILIRKWPVHFIALVYFALEVFRTWQKYEMNEISDVAHMAHLGGFILAYAMLPIIRKGTDWEGEIEVEELPLEHPFVGFDDLVKRLREEGDEKETRQAWMEEISEKANCPVCEGKMEVHRMRIRCTVDKSHLTWP